MNLVKTVIATFDVVGFHRWPAAVGPTGYLRAEHRHRFGVQVECRVSDSDREVEYHALAREARARLGELYTASAHGEFAFDAHSCEHIAEALLKALRVTGTAATAVEVWEDAEHGSRVELAP